MWVGEDSLEMRCKLGSLSFAGQKDRVGGTALFLVLKLLPVFLLPRCRQEPLPPISSFYVFSSSRAPVIKKIRSLR